MSNEYVQSAIRILQELHADITVSTIWTILDLQGIVDYIPHEEIEAAVDKRIEESSSE